MGWQYICAKGSGEMMGDLVSPRGMRLPDGGRKDVLWYIVGYAEEMFMGTVITVWSNELESMILSRM